MKKWFSKIILTTTIIFLYSPILMIIIESFNKSKVGSVWESFSLHWYIKIFTEYDVLNSLLVSCKIAFISALLATILGVIIGIATKKRENRIDKLFSSIIYIPIIMPDVIIGFSMLMLFITAGIERGVTTLLISHITYSACFITLIVQTRLDEKTQRLEDAAVDLGCNRFSAFLNITILNISKTLLSCWLIAFSLSFDDLILAAFTHGKNTITFPINMYSKIHTGITPEMSAVSTIIIISIFLFLFIMNKLLKKKH